MGCATSKHMGLQTPAVDTSCIVRDDRKGIQPIRKSSRQHRTGQGDEKACEERKEEEEKESVRGECTDGALSSGIRLGNVPKQIEGEQVAAGWPSWLSNVAGEAIQGWLPLNASSFEKMEKIGQGTYSSVFRAQNLETRKLVALKKVRFDNFDPESVRFMAREIKILRRLDHPNIIKLEGLIASRLSCTLYLVFEYMEHDLSGLSSCSDITFSESQIKCYVQQLLQGLQHCHSRGVMHRDIKGANLLVNNEGVLKMADFGLAKCYTPGKKQSLTSRVVTLWYRPPELLLGSTDYEESIDLWSVGCVFAEMYIKRPILQGRTEVEQLHKIFRLCGSPPDEYWRNSKLPNSTMFRPIHPYPSTVQETFQHLPASAISLIETLLSVEPRKRGTASDALASKYCTEAPYACAPSSLPKYQPTKEIDIKYRGETRRSRFGGRGLGSGAIRRPLTNNRASGQTGQPNQVADFTVEPQSGAHLKKHLPVVDSESRLSIDLQPMPSITSRDEANRIRLKDITFSGPLQFHPIGFPSAQRQQEGRPFGRSKSRHASRSQRYYARDQGTMEKVENNGDVNNSHSGPKGQAPTALTRKALRKNWTQREHPVSFDASALRSQDFSDGLSKGITKTNQVDFSGLLFSQSRRVDEQLLKNERRRAARRSWFQMSPLKKERDVETQGCFSFSLLQEEKPTEPK